MVVISNDWCRSCGEKEKKNWCEACEWISHYTREVYLLSTKLQKFILNDQLGENQEMNLINFITRFGYGMRRGPHVTLHGAYSQYTSLNQRKKTFKDALTMSTVSFLLIYSYSCYIMYASLTRKTSHITCW